MKGLLCILVTIIFAFSCREQRKATIVDNAEPTDQINGDSLIKLINQFTAGYFKNNSIDSIVTINGKPNHINIIQWGDNERDSLLIVGYNVLRFSFWKPHLSNQELESIQLFDKKVRLPGQLCIGSTTRQEIIQSLGLPDDDHNDPGRTMTKSGDTTVVGTKSGAGDTVTFTYRININEFAIHFGMTKDTLRKVTWAKNVY